MSSQTSDSVSSQDLGLNRVYTAKLVVTLPGSRSQTVKVHVDLKLNDLSEDSTTKPVEYHLEAKDISFINQSGSLDPITYQQPILSLPPISTAHLGTHQHLINFRTSPSPSSLVSRSPASTHSSLHPPPNFPQALPPISRFSTPPPRPTLSRPHDRAATPTHASRQQDSRHFSAGQYSASGPSDDLFADFTAAEPSNSTGLRNSQSLPALSPMAAGKFLPSLPDADIFTGAVSLANKNITLPLKPAPFVERMIAPSIRSAADERHVKECVTDALKHARQFAGSRPCPLIQIDRFISRIELFCYLHNYGRWPAPADSSNGLELPVYWSDLLKFGGLGTAWNEKKNRRPYKHIYADVVAHQGHPAIRPFLESERGKSLDELEAAFESLFKRSLSNVYGIATDVPAPDCAAPAYDPNAFLASPNGHHPTASSSKAASVVTTNEEIRVDQASSEDAAMSSQGSNKKRKRDETVTPVVAYDLLPIPTLRLSAPSSRPPGAEAEVKQALVSAMVQANQWSGSRPSVISSIQGLIARILLLIRIHDEVTVGSNQVTIYWSDAIKYGGISQAWSSKKAGRAAFRQTYSQLLQHQDHPDIANILKSSQLVDVKTVEIQLAKLSASQDTSQVENGDTEMTVADGSAASSSPT